MAGWRAVTLTEQVCPVCPPVLAAAGAPKGLGCVGSEAFDGEQTRWDLGCGCRRVPWARGGLALHASLAGLPFRHSDLLEGRFVVVETTEQTFDASSGRAQKAGEPVDPWSRRSNQR